MFYNNTSSIYLLVFVNRENIWGVTWSNNSLLTGSLDGTVKVWNRGSSLTCQATSTPQKFGVNSVAAVTDGSIAVASYQNGSIRFFQTSNMTEVASIEPGVLEAWTICLSPNDEVLASGTQSGAVNIWSMQDNHEKVVTLQTGNKLVLSSQFSIDAKLAASSLDGYLNIFDVSTQTVVHKIDAHSLPARSVTFSPDGRLVYTASDDRHVSVFDTLSGTAVNSFSHRGMALSVDASPDGRHFVVGCADHSVYLWDLGMQRRVQSYEQHGNQVWGVSFKKSEATGKQVFASVGDDGLLQLYE